jgi:transposase
MGRKRYVKAPVPDESSKPLYDAMMRVLSGELTVTQAAESVGLSRVRFQTLMHRGLSGLLEAVAEQPRGRPAKPEKERQLEEELERLRRENSRLTKQVQSTARMMDIASDWMRKGLSSTRSPTTRPTETPPANDGEDDAPARKLRAVEAMTAQGVVQSLAANAVGVSAPTVRRWKSRCRNQQPLRNNRGPRPSRPAASPVAQRLLEESGGCIGAAAVARMSGVSRRAAAELKRNLLRALEHSRREGTTRVETQVGVIRGLDAMMVGKVPLLVSGDGATPYRTIIRVVSSYQGSEVARTIADDFEKNGAPLVWRCDRATSHETPEVLEVLRAHQVLLLHGPPRCPGFYGQLERQNREHRAWLEAICPASRAELEQTCEKMRTVFNEMPRRKLRWRSASDVWNTSPRLEVDRRELAEEVLERRMKWEASGAREPYAGHFERLAIEAALINRGLLSLTKGGWC